MLRVFVAVILLLTATGLAATTGLGLVNPEESPPAQGISIANQEFDRTTFRINVSENGSARWTFIHRRDLSNETEREQFVGFAEEFDEESDLYVNFKQRAQRLTTMGTNETGRQMNATAFSSRVYVSGLDNSGIIEMSFRWSNFSMVKGNRIIVGDVFEGGLYIGPNQRLTVTWSENLSYSSASPKPDDRSGDTVTWTAANQNRQFYDSEPRVVLQSTVSTPSNVGTTETSPENENENTSSELWPIGFGVLALLLIVAAVAYRSEWIKRAEDRTQSDATTNTPTNSTEQSTAITEAELMTDEDRVLSLLRDNDGRMKQVNIVNETGWSKSKVSMLLSDMDDEGLISKLRVGRENIISLAGDEPEAARSPFEEN